MTKMIESLPDPVQERVVEHLRNYIEDLRDESEWDSQFESSQTKLVDLAWKARKEIAQGKAKPLDIEAL